MFTNMAIIQYSNSICREKKIKSARDKQIVKGTLNKFQQDMEGTKNCC